MARRPAVAFVIIAGGRGERLWPLVRTTRPKVCLSADGKHSLLQATVQRLKPLWPGARWMVVTTAEQAAAVRDNLPPALRRHVVVEPQGRNTAACITLAAATLAVRDPRRVMVVVPADHWVGSVDAFRRSVRAAIQAADTHDAIVTIGVPPTHPHPGLGYLCAGARLPGPRRARIFRLRRFVEKPSRARARRLLRRPRTYWNSGLFVGTADKFLECLTEWLPNHTQRLIPLVNGRGRLSAVTGKARKAYRALQAVSFDHGVMDHLRDGIVVEGRFGWADLGSWDTWARLSPNVSSCLAVESDHVTVVSQDPHLVAAIGVRDLLVVHTPSATLICPVAKVQAVRQVVRRLSQSPRLARYR